MSSGTPQARTEAGDGAAERNEDPWRWPNRAIQPVRRRSGSPAAAWVVPDLGGL